MKTIEYLCCALTCMCLLKAANTEISKDKFERQLLDALTEKIIRPKRPFCNAFTGCGRFFPDEKRSFATNTRRDSQDFQATSNSIRLPVSLYRTLLNAAKGNAWNTIDREEYNYRLQQMPQAYLLDRMPLRDILES